jgi:hypothetical protein
MLKRHTRPVSGFMGYPQKVPTCFAEAFIFAAKKILMNLEERVVLRITSSSQDKR